MIRYVLDYTMGGESYCGLFLFGIRGDDIYVWVCSILSHFPGLVARRGWGQSNTKSFFVV